ncbi:hypothetical protein ANCCEY_14235 [Ancylostoma ceylanicum]|uniref:Phospholipase B-like n=1 Tax=Ancylostoma ceylanicum TaxID=53326 RepID=A0A0D6L5W0_9BILA|nr:hypothetical protein ANCCEY_14235 [Ancylostoma ceylanicum]
MTKLLLLHLLLLVLCYGLCENQYGQMYYYKEYEGQENVCEKDVAKVKYSNRINETGWAFVEVEVSGRVNEPYQQGYAAGYVEGMLLFTQSNA